MNEALSDLILHRVFADSTLKAEVAERVLAACDGPEALRRCLSGETSPRRSPKAADEGERPGVFLSSIEVGGFRGIGPPQRLPVKPGPGLTVIVGRNGSGKSSFAEGLEFLLTRENHRWKHPRPRVWRDGWRNLHQPDPAFLRAEFLLEGEPGPTRAWMEWEPGAPLESGEPVVQPHAGHRRSLRKLGWEQPLESYRPFLSYSELGTALVNEPSKFYNSLSNILGLGDLVAAGAVLKEEGAARRQSDGQGGHGPAEGPPAPPARGLRGRAGQGLPGCAEAPPLEARQGAGADRARPRGACGLRPGLHGPSGTHPHPGGGGGAARGGAPGGGPRPHRRRSGAADGGAAGDGASAP